MTNAKDSIIPEFKEKIDMLNCNSHFEVSGNDIINTKSNSRILFRGINTSSGNQTAKLKSINNLTCWVLDEAEEMRNEEEFDKIDLSIRKKNATNRVIIVMNPCDKEHFMYRRFFEGGKKDDTVYIHTTYLDNLANLSEAFVKQAEQTKLNNPRKYKHIFLGEWDSGDDMIFTEGYTEYNEAPNSYDWKLYGGDFGYSNDPTTLIEVIKVKNNLYLRECIYLTGLLNNDISSIMLKEGYNDELSIWDSADGLKSVNELRMLNINADGAIKGAGSVYWGIEKIKQFNIFIHEDSHNLKKEWRNYRWAKDNNGNYKRNVKGQKVPYVANPPQDHCIDAVRYAISYYLEIEQKDEF
jgi:phage terminase large subunit